MRIATLLPSATEIVCALGLRDQLVGVSHSCDFPGDVAELPRLTHTHVPYERSSREIDDYVRDHLGDHTALYELDMATLEAVKPDVIVSQALCDVCAVATGDVEDAIGSLPGPPQLVDLNPNTLDDVLDDCSRVGEQTGATAAANELCAALRGRRDSVRERTAAIPMNDRPRLTFLEWLVPPFCGGHWNPELVELAGAIDLLGRPGKPSTTISWSQVAACEPEALLVACCGFDTQRSIDDIALLTEENVWEQLPAATRANVYVADGDDYFARPGPRLIDGLEILAHALHPAIHPPSAAGKCVKISL